MCNIKNHCIGFGVAQLGTKPTRIIVHNEAQSLSLSSVIHGTKRKKISRKSVKRREEEGVMHFGSVVMVLSLMSFSGNRL